MLAERFQWTCRCCGEVRTGLPMDFGYERPDFWDGLNEAEQAQSRRDEDFCYVKCETGEEYYFIRCVLALPAVELEDEFCFGVWMSVSKDSFGVYAKGVTSEIYDRDVCFGYVANELPAFVGSRGLHANVYFSDGGARPSVGLHEADHPLVEAQRDGVDAAQIQRWMTPYLAH